jgi:hypothetical protein
MDRKGLCAIISNARKQTARIVFIGGTSGSSAKRRQVLTGLPWHRAIGACGRSGPNKQGQHSPEESGLPTPPISLNFDGRTIRFRVSDCNISANRRTIVDYLIALHYNQ